MNILKLEDTRKPYMTLEMAAICVTCTAQNGGSSGNSDGSWNLMGLPWAPSRRIRLVKTESNVRREKRVIPQPPCEVCQGLCKIKCWQCSGRGRTNLVDRVMLPRGAWPQWCEECRGSGLAHCGRCLGTGERRGAIGFHSP